MEGGGGVGGRGVVGGRRCRKEGGGVGGRRCGREEGGGGQEKEEEGVGEKEKRRGIRKITNWQCIVLLQHLVPRTVNLATQASGTVIPLEH